MQFHRLSEQAVAGKRVFIRADLNVPQNDAGAITDDTRIRASVPAIRDALARGAAVMVTSHLGRPTEGEVRAEDSLAPIALRLGELLGCAVPLVGNWVDGVTVAPGEVVLLENCRCNKGEKKNDAALAQKIAALCDIYVNDAFGTAHRAHSSMVGVAIKEKAAGFLMEAELKAFAKVLDNPDRPLLAILGGAKIADKIPLINNLLDKANKLIIGGGMAYTFHKVNRGMKIGSSLFDKTGAEIVAELEAKAKARGVELIFPVDFVCGDKFGPDANTQPATLESGIPDGWEGMDAGPKSIALYRQAILASKTIVWNGPPGVFEFEKFAGATKAMADAIAEATAKGATTVVGGGDTATAAKKFKVADKVTHCSTGGGASLEFLEGKVLPGVAFLEN